MDNGSKVLVLMGVILFAMFAGMSLTIYELKLKIKEMDSNVDAIEIAILETKVDQDGLATVMVNGLNQAQEQRVKSQEKISILEESVDSKDKRWATIKKVRTAIESTAYNPPPILELTSIASAVVDYSDEYDVSTSLVLGIIRQESNFNRKAVSHATAQGLMQVMPQTAKEIAGDVGKRYYSLFNVKNNVQFGVYYIRKMLDTFDGDIELAIRAYNCGPTYVGRMQAGEYKNYPEETAQYLVSVLEWKAEYEKLGL